MITALLVGIIIGALGRDLRLSVRRHRDRDDDDDGDDQQRRLK